MPGQAILQLRAGLETFPSGLPPTREHTRDGDSVFRRCDRRARPRGVREEKPNQFGRVSRHRAHGRLRLLHLHNEVAVEEVKETV